MNANTRSAIQATSTAAASAANTTDETATVNSDAGQIKNFNLLEILIIFLHYCIYKFKNTFLISISKSAFNWANETHSDDGSGPLNQIRLKCLPDKSVFLILFTRRLVEYIVYIIYTLYNVYT